MRYLPIIDELFHSNSYLFLLLGLAVSLAAGAGINRARTAGITALCSAAVYALCEALSNLHTNFLLELFLLFVGTAAIGATLGYLIKYMMLRASGQSK